MPGARILLVEDDAVLCGLLARNLEVRGQSFPSCHANQLLSVRTVQRKSRGRARLWRAHVPSIETS